MKSSVEKTCSKIVGYCRVSTKLQMNGLEAQRAAIKAHAERDGANVLAFYEDKETGKEDMRPGLRAALDHAKRDGATLVIAKLDRLSRHAGFIHQLADSGLDFKALDLPDFNTLTLGIFAAMAQHERELISDRTKAGLAIARAKGRVGGNPSGFGPEARAAGIRVRKERAIMGTIDAAKAVKMFRRDGLGLREIARRLVELGVPTRRGGTWTASAVKNLIKLHGIDDAQEVQQCKQE